MKTLILTSLAFCLMASSCLVIPEEAGQPPGPASNIRKLDPSISQLINGFESLGFTFEQGEDVGGESQFLGEETALGTAAVEILGSGQNATAVYLSIYMHAGISERDEEVMGDYLVSAIEYILSPSYHQSGVDWLYDNLVYYGGESFEAEKIFGDVTFNLQFSEKLDIVLLSFTPAP